MCGVADRLVQTCCVAVPFSQFFPDVTLMQNVEKLGIVGILSGVICMLVMDRRSMQRQLNEMRREQSEITSKVLNLVQKTEENGDSDVLHS